MFSKSSFLQCVKIGIYGGKGYVIPKVCVSKSFCQAFILQFQMALTHRKLLQSWRERSKMGQLETRRVLAEMLTPAGKFVLFFVYPYMVVP